MNTQRWNEEVERFKKRNSGIPLTKVGILDHPSCVLVVDNVHHVLEATTWRELDLKVSDAVREFVLNEFPDLPP